MTIEKKVEAFFNRTEDCTEVHGTSDGFLFRKKDHARAHALTLNKKEVKTFKNKKVEKPKSINVLDGSIKDVEGAIKDIKDIQVIDALIIQEQDNANRKGAIEVLEDHKETLTEKE